MVLLIWAISFPGLKTLRTTFVRRIRGFGKLEVKRACQKNHEEDLGAPLTRGGDKISRFVVGTPPVFEDLDLHSNTTQSSLNPVLSSPMTTCFSSGAVI